MSFEEELQRTLAQIGVTQVPTAQLDALRGVSRLQELLSEAAMLASNPLSQQAAQVLAGISGATSTSKTLAQQMADVTRANSALSTAKSLATETLNDALSKVFETTGLNSKLAAISSAHEAIRVADITFRTTEAAEYQNAIKLLQVGPNKSVLDEIFLEAQRFQELAAGATSPWINSKDAGRSISALSELQIMGAALTSLPTYEDLLAIPLRRSLGDWRDAITLPLDHLLQEDTRLTLYLEKGFDRALTEFPRDVFVDTTALIGLRDAPNAAHHEYDLAPNNFDTSEDDEEFLRSTRTQTALLKLERHIRYFIDTLMTSAYGKDWPKSRLPNGLYEAWLEKQRNALLSGEQPQSLICFADFTDYERIINRKDNWKEVFLTYFRRQENIRETFNRLMPIRVAAYHARLISQDDELFLLVESRRLYRAFAVMA
jgi:hypothetical protein